MLPAEGPRLFFWNRQLKGDSAVKDLGWSITTSQSRWYGLGWTNGLLRRQRQLHLFKGFYGKPFTASFFLICEMEAETDSLPQQGKEAK